MIAATSQVPDDKVRLGISACLLGERVRFDGGHKRDSFLVDVFGPHVEWVPVCPEVELGLGVPRDSLRLVDARHKFLLMAHSQTRARLLGADLAAEARHRRAASLAAMYWNGFTNVMAHVPTRKSHTNVLQHLAGYVSDRLSRADRGELAELIDQYRRRLLPLIVPMTLLRHYGRKFEIAYMNNQIYLNPHPRELMLLNHV